MQNLCKISCRQKSSASSIRSSHSSISRSSCRGEMAPKLAPPPKPCGVRPGARGGALGRASHPPARTARYPGRRSDVDHPQLGSGSIGGAPPPPTLCAFGRAAPWANRCTTAEAELLRDSSVRIKGSQRRLPMPAAATDRLGRGARRCASHCARDAPVKHYLFSALFNCRRAAVELQQRWAASIARNKTRPIYACYA